MRKLALCLVLLGCGTEKPLGPNFHTFGDKSEPTGSIRIVLCYHDGRVNPPECPPETP